MSSRLPKPKRHGITAYGRRGCSYSENAANMTGVTYHQLNDYFKSPQEFFPLVKHLIGNHRTFPIVFVDGNFIGGYTELLNL